MGGDSNPDADNFFCDFRIFDQKYTVEGIESPIRLRIKDVIFVMEVSRLKLEA